MKYIYTSRSELVQRTNPKDTTIDGKEKRMVRLKLRGKGKTFLHQQDVQVQV